MILEKRYRAALRWYPASWRAANGDAAIGTLLDKAEGEGRTAPRTSELANLAAHGVAERLRMAPSAVPATIRDRASTAALAVGTAIALTATMQLEVFPREQVEFFGREPATFGPFTSPVIIIYAAWVAAFFASVAGYTKAARWIAAATIPLTVASRVVADATGMYLRPTWTFLGVLIMLSLIVAAGSPAPGRRGVRWLILWLLPALFAFSSFHTGGSGFAFQEPLWLRRPDLLSWSPIIAVGIAAVLQLTPQRSWSAGVLIVAAPFAAVAVLGGRGISMEIAGYALAIAVAALVLMVLLRAFGFSVRIQRTRRTD